LSYDNACKYLAEQYPSEFVRWLLGIEVQEEDIMRESVIYQDIVQKEAFKLISRLLNRRFSELDSSLIERVRKLSAEQLEDLGEALLDFSEVTDLLVWLDQERS
jgi:predicted transposase YdaD